ncbi:RGS domain containing protein [Yasminevirus sp. GU-2018]|uniref:RGS domain containing protein n=1 Tax=Yasminevirus sp. GU-2018 TaxID=2420051 RepID=A0A5K0U9R1_9VIRU|nr:RGS domain containing protein [Yasminevirus sp. GU-2018]
MPHKKYKSLPDIKNPQNCENEIPQVPYNERHRSKLGIKIKSDNTLTTKALVIVIDNKERVITSADVKESMADCLSQSDSYVVFKYFCEKVAHTEELYLFLEEYRRYKSLFGKASLNEIIEHAKKISSKFIEQESHHALNLFDVIRAKILTKTKHINGDGSHLVLLSSEGSWAKLFDEAHDDVMNTLEYDTYPKFREWVTTNASAGTSAGTSGNVSATSTSAQAHTVPTPTKHYTAQTERLGHLVQQREKIEMSNQSNTLRTGLHGRSRSIKRFFGL